MKNFTEWIVEDKNQKEKYQTFFKNKLKEWEIETITELSTEDKKKFFNEIESEWKGEKEDE